MASATDSTNNDDGAPGLTWSRRATLANRILALNLLTVMLVVLSTLFLDVFRNHLSRERVRQTRIEATAVALAIDTAGSDKRQQILAVVSRATGTRMRLFAPDGRLVVDSWATTGPTYQLQDPRTQDWTKPIARTLDRGFNALVLARTLDDFVEPATDRGQAWPEVVEAA
jgi:two-component system sensor histidine kinase ChvG